MLNNREDITRYKMEREKPYLLINCWGFTGRIVTAHNYYGRLQYGDVMDIRE